jgi:hypothetical protein
VGEEVSAQASVTVPVYPLLAVTVTVELVAVPAETAAGVVADNE